MSISSQRIKALIEQSDQTYQELERQTGIKKSSLQRYASGVTTKIPPKAIEALSKYFNVTPNYLLGFDPQSQLDTLAYEIAQLQEEISNATADQIEELEYQLAIKEESYEDLCIGFSLVSLQKNNSPTEPQLSEGEARLIELFRKVPADRQQLVLQMIETALRNL